MRGVSGGRLRPLAVVGHEQPGRSASSPVAPGGEVGHRELLEDEAPRDHVVGAAAVHVGRHLVVVRRHPPEGHVHLAAFALPEDLHAQRIAGPAPRR